MQNVVKISCFTCGGTVSPMPDNPSYFRCDYCGALVSTMATRENAKLEGAFAQLRKSNFDEAEELFSEIIIASPKCHEAFWGRLLSKFGIIYINDYVHSKKVPTINKTSSQKFTADSDYIGATTSAPIEAQQYYAEQAGYIEKLRVRQQEVASKRTAYDVFICYKESDEASKIERTQDSYDCSELYVHLVSQGLKVFYARESLRECLAEDYEPYIYNALATAKVMVVYGTRPDYIKATWVKNEWSRYKQMIDLGQKQSNSLVVAVSNMPMSEMPTALATRQSLDANSRTFYTDLVAHINKVISGDSAKMYCLKCGELVPKMAQFCFKCGRKMNGEAQASQYTAYSRQTNNSVNFQPYQPSEKAKKKKGDDTFREVKYNDAMVLMLVSIFLTVAWLTLSIILTAMNLELDFRVVMQDVPFSFIQTLIIVISTIILILRFVTFTVILVIGSKKKFRWRTDRKKLLFYKITVLICILNMVVAPLQSVLIILL